MYITYGYTFRFAWQCHKHVNVYTFKRTLINVHRHNEPPLAWQTCWSSVLALAIMTHPPAGYSDCLSFKMLERPNHCYGPAKALRELRTHRHTHTVGSQAFASRTHTNKRTYLIYKCTHKHTCRHTQFPLLTKHTAWFPLVVSSRSTQPAVYRNNSFSIPNGCTQTCC